MRGSLERRSAIKKKSLGFLVFLLAIALTACNLPAIIRSAANAPNQNENTSTDITLEPTEKKVTPQTSTQLPINSTSLIQPEMLEYLGAFRLPEGSGDSNWEYSGRGLTYFPDGDAEGAADGFPGSLYGTGQDQHNFVSEISIPVPVNSRNLDDLNTATTLQSFADITEGMFGETDLPRLGIQYLPALEGQDSGKLYFVHGQHFQDFEASHGWSELDLSHPHPAGPWFFDGYTNYVTSDYLFEIPANWSTLLPGSPQLAGGRFREGVWGGFGPALFAFSPIQNGQTLEPYHTLENVSPLLLYGVQEPDQTDILTSENQQMNGYNADDRWWGGAWLTSNERASVIFVGTKALGKSWYGFANGVVWEYDCADKNPPTCPEVPEWPYENRGYWAENYQPQMIFYNPADLVKVANGELQSWEPQPYATLDLSQYFYDPKISLENYKFDIAGAVAYDRERGYLYVVERLADGSKSVIHVWKIN